MDQYTFSPGLKKTSIGLVVVGFLLAAAEFILGHGEHAGQRFWSNLLIDGFFFFSIALAATFFLGIQYAAEAGWAVVIKRILEAVGSFLIPGAGILLIVFGTASLHLGGNHLYHWMDHEAVAHDEILQHKTPYLNIPFFWARFIFFVVGYIWYWKTMRKRSLLEDVEGGTKIHFGNQKLSAIFLVFFGFTSVVAIWDWIMSIDTHWFSTLFAWYVFSGMWIGAIISVILIIIYLQSKGYLPQVNKYHYQDLGKWMFAISFLWTYLWFSQFMLIWYADIPEEVIYYQARFEDYTVLYWAMIIINFVFPMLILMDKENKRSKILLSVVGVVLFFFHFVDVYFLVTPGAMKADGHFGFVEIGMFLGFLGVFIFVVFNTLSKAPLLVKNHPYLDESLHLHQN